MTQDEKRDVIELFARGGSAAVLKKHPHLSPVAIRSFAARKGLKAPKGLPRPWREDNTPWAVPAQDVLQQLDCLRLRKWRGPVLRTPLVASLGRAA